MKECLVMFTVNVVDFMGKVHVTEDADVSNLVGIYQYVEQAAIFKDNDRVEIMDDKDNLVLVIDGDSDAVSEINSLISFYS